MQRFGALRDARWLEPAVFAYHGVSGAEQHRGPLEIPRPQAEGVERGRFEAGTVQCSTQKRLSEHLILPEAQWHPRFLSPWWSSRPPGESAHTTSTHGC